METQAEPPLAFVVLSTERRITHYVSEGHCMPYVWELRRISYGEFEGI